MFGALGIMDLRWLRGRSYKSKPVAASSGARYHRDPRPIRSARRRPHSISGLSDLDVGPCRESLPLPTPEERLREISRSQPVTLVPIDVTGTPFCRQASWRESLRCSSREYLEEGAARSMPRRRVRRRQTVSGVTDLLGHAQAYGEPFCVRSSYDLRTRSASRDRWHRRSCLIVETYQPRRGRELERGGGFRHRDDSPNAVSRSCSLTASLRSLFSKSARRARSRDLWVEGPPRSPGPPVVTVAPQRPLRRSRSLPRSLKSWLRASTERLVPSRAASTEGRLDEPLQEQDEEDEGYSEDDIETPADSVKATKKTPTTAGARSMRPRTLEFNNAKNKGSQKTLIPVRTPTTPADQERQKTEAAAWPQVKDVKLREPAKQDDRQSSSGHWSGSSGSSARASLESPERRSQTSLERRSETDKDSALSLNGHSSSTCTSEDQDTTDNNPECGEETSTLNGDTSTLNGDVSTLNGDEEPAEPADGGKDHFTRMNSDDWLQSVTHEKHSKQKLQTADLQPVERVGLTLQALRAHDSAHPALPQPIGCHGDEGSSVYSVDAEGFYSTMHKDSGVGRTTQCSPPGYSTFLSSQSSASSLGSSSQSKRRNLLGRIPGLRRLGGSRSKRHTPPPPPMRSSSTSLSKESNLSLSSGLPSPGLPLCASSRQPSPGVSLQRTASVETVGSVTGDDQLQQRQRRQRQRHLPGDASCSESDAEGVAARLRAKTSISAAAIPALCTVTPCPSDDEARDNTPSPDGFATWPRKRPSPDEPRKKAPLPASPKVGMFDSNERLDRDLREALPEHSKQTDRPLSARSGRECLKETMSKMTSPHAETLEEHYERTLLVTPEKAAPPADGQQHVFATVIVRPVTAHSGDTAPAPVLSTFTSDDVTTSPTHVTVTSSMTNAKQESPDDHVGGTWPRSPRKSPKKKVCSSFRQEAADINTSPPDGTATFPRQKAGAARKPTHLPVTQVYPVAQSTPQPAHAQLIISSPVSATPVMKENPFKRSLCSPVSPEDLMGFWNKGTSKKLSPRSSSIEESPMESVSPRVNEPSMLPVTPEVQEPPDNSMHRSKTFDSGNSLLVSKPLFASLSAMKHSISFPVSKKEPDGPANQAELYGASWYDGVPGTDKKPPVKPRSDASPGSGRLSFATYLRGRRNSNTSTNTQGSSGIFYENRRDSNASSVSTGSRGSRVTFALGTKPGDDRRSAVKGEEDADSWSRSSYSDDSRSLSSFGKASPTKQKLDCMQDPATRESGVKRFKAAHTQESPAHEGQADACVDHKRGGARVSPQHSAEKVSDTPEDTVAKPKSLEAETCIKSKDQPLDKNKSPVLQSRSPALTPPAVSVNLTIVSSGNQPQTETKPAPLASKGTKPKDTKSVAAVTAAATTIPRYKPTFSPPINRSARGSTTSLYKFQDNDLKTKSISSVQTSMSRSTTNIAAAGMESSGLNASKALATSTGSLAGISNTLGGSRSSLARSTDSLSSVSSRRAEQTRAAKLAFLAQANEQLRESEGGPVDAQLWRRSSSVSSSRKNSSASTASSDCACAAPGSGSSASSKRSSPTQGRFVTSVIHQLSRQNSAESTPGNSPTVPSGEASKPVTAPAQRPVTLTGSLTRRDPTGKPPLWYRPSLSPPAVTTTNKPAGTPTSSVTGTPAFSTGAAHRPRQPALTPPATADRYKPSFTPPVTTPTDKTTLITKLSNPYVKLSILRKQPQDTGDTGVCSGSAPANGVSDFKNLLRNHRSNLKSVKVTSPGSPAIQQRYLPNPQTT